MDEDIEILSITKGNKFKVHRGDFDNNKVVLAFNTDGLKTIKLTMKENWLLVKVKSRHEQCRSSSVSSEEDNQENT